jgi:hypothetical protein
MEYMETMPSSVVEPVDLLDLKLLPAWVKETGETENYTRYAGDEQRRVPEKRHNRKNKRSRTSARELKGPRQPDLRGQMRGRRPGIKAQRKGDWHHPITPKLLQVGIRFLPYRPALEHVTAQIKSGSVAYSLFALARLFLEKPQRYEVRLTAKAELPLFQLGGNGAFSPNREFLERNAFRFALEDFYKIDSTQSEPIKGNFSNVARCRLSGTLLGPTNHHNYQPQLRSLYEQHFSRRMNFADYQRQIEIVNDAALLGRWKEEARTVTTYTTLREETPSAFQSAAEAERHFRARYLPGLIRGVDEVNVGGVLSRRLPDRMLNRAIEDAWTREMHSPSSMMQVLAARFRQAGLNVFRYRRGMLFVSPVRPRPFVGEQAGVSTTVNAILKTVGETPVINGRELFEKLIVDAASEGAESHRLRLASDLRWLISEGYIIEFNDGSLDLPRVKPKPAVVPAVLAASENVSLAAASAPIPVSELEIGGS